MQCRQLPLNSKWRFLVCCLELRSLRFGVWALLFILNKTLNIDKSYIYYYIKNMKRALLYIVIILLLLFGVSCTNNIINENTVLTPVKTGVSSDEGQNNPPQESSSLFPERKPELRYAQQMTTGNRVTGYWVSGYNYIGSALVIPETYDDGINGELPVYGISSEAFRDCDYLKSVTIPYSIKDIDSEAFADCSSLQTVNFSEQSNLTQISDNTFSGCTSLQSITIPSSVKYIGSEAFANCKRLENVRFVDDSKLEAIGKNAFLNCNKIAEIVIPDSLSLMDSAFNGCTSLKKVTVPFIGTRKTTTFLYPEIGKVIEEWTEGGLLLNFGSATNSIESITVTGGNRTANFDMSRVSITLNEGMTLSLSAKITALPSLSYPQGSTLIVEEGGKFRVENNCVIDSDGTLCRVPEDIDSFPQVSGVKKIGEKVFTSCEQYTDIVLPSSIEDIDLSAFNKLSVLSLSWDGNEKYRVQNNCIIEKESEKVVWGCSSSTIPEGTLIIGESAFEGTKIENVIFPSSLTEIKERAFYECTTLSSVTIPSDCNLTTIGIRAFGHCEDLSSFPIANALKKIDDYAFSYCLKLNSFTFNPSLYFIGKQAFCCTALSSVVLSECIVDDGCFCDCKELISADFSLLKSQFLASNVLYGCTKLQTVTLPDHVLYLGSCCFYRCVSLSEITLPSELVSIGEKDFFECSALKTMLIPANVTQIGNNAFYKCSGLESFIFESTVPFYYRLSQYEKENNPFAEADVPIDVSTTERNIKTFVKYSKIGYYER